MKPHVHKDEDAHDHPEARPLPVNPNEVIQGGMPAVDETPRVATAPPPLSEAIHLGAEYWFAREFVGGLLSVAEAMKIPPQDFLADKVFMLSQRLALAESEVEILRHQVMTGSQENIDLHRRLDDCNCHDEATFQSLSDTGLSLSTAASTDLTNNGEAP